MTKFKNVKKQCNRFGLALFGMLLSTPIFAAAVTDAGSLFGQAGEQASTAQSGFVQIAGFIGLILFAVSGIKLFNSRENSQEGKGKLWMGLFAGVFLMGLYTWMAVASNTATGDTQSADDIKSVISGGT